MKKIWQKSLASMVSAALCLTAFVGCLTVNAADYQGSITSAGASVTTEDTQATVTLTLTSPAAMNVAAIAATSTYGTLVSVTENEEGYYIDETKLLSEGKFYVDANDNEAGFNTANVVLTFTKAEGVVANTYPVTVTYFAGESAATWAEETVELVVDGEINIVVTEPVVDPEPVEEDYITYTGATYDIATSKITVYRDALSQKMKDVISEALAAGNAKPQLIVDVDGTEFTFPVSLTYGAGYLEASGFALTHMNLTVKMYIRLTANNEYVFNTNAYEVVLADVVAGMADTDPKAAALVGLNNEWLNTTESYVITDSIAKEEGLITYTDATYDVKTSKIKINRAELSQDMKDVIAGAVSNGNAKPQLIVDVEGTEFVFPVSLTYGAGYIEASGFALPHFTQNVKMYIRIVSGASGEYVVNTNAVTINLHNIVSAATDSNFANAYNTYYNAQ